MKNLDKIIARLEELAAGDDPEDVDEGICFDIDSLFPDGDACEFVGELAKDWPHYSGNPEYPVPCAGFDDPQNAYFCHINLWTGAYGDLRRDLCRHLAEKLKGEKA